MAESSTPNEQSKIQQEQRQGLPASCQCGYVTFQTPTAKPAGMAFCHCTECRKQSSSAFGTSAYWPAKSFFPLPAELEARLSVVKRKTDAGNTMHCYFCPKCGSRTFHVAYLPDGRMRDMVSVKGGCVDGLDWAGVRHIFTRSAVIEIPKDAEQYETLPPVWHGKAAEAAK
jgi:hypothetical protein